MPADRRRIEVRRVYEPAADPGAYRALVDRLWPRGIAKADLDLDEWAKDAAPSTSLRKWYGHDIERFDEFGRRYRAELRQDPAAATVERLAATARRRCVVLLTATRDVDHSAARVLYHYLIDR